MSNDSKTEGRHVTMYPSQWRIVETCANTAPGLSGNTSAALRQIVDEWHRLRLRFDNRLLVDPPAEYEVE